MGNIIKSIENHLIGDPSILALIDSSIGLFIDDDEFEQKFLKVKKTNILDTKDKDAKQFFYDMDLCTLTLKDSSPLQIAVHGNAIKRSIYKMYNYNPTYDASDFSSPDEWMDVANVNDASMYIPVDTIIKVIFNDSNLSFDSSLNLYNLEMDFIIIGNIEKVKK